MSPNNSISGGCLDRLQSLTASSHGALVPKTPIKHQPAKHNRNTKSGLGEPQGALPAVRRGTAARVGVPGARRGREPAPGTRVVGRSPRGKPPGLSARAEGPGSTRPGAHCIVPGFGERGSELVKGTLPPPGKGSRGEAGVGGLQASTREGNGGTEQLIQRLSQILQNCSQ